jgi:glycerol-3-phosphate O-acyltransferase
MMHLTVPPSDHFPKRDSFKSIIKPNINKYLDGLIRKLAIRVKFSEEQAAAIKLLAAKGPVIYALKNKSHLNSLMLREIAERQDIPVPRWTLGEEPSLTGKPASLANDETTAMFPGPDSAVLHLGSSRLVNDPVVEDALACLIQCQERLERPIFIVPLLISYGRRRDVQDESLFNILFGQYDDVGAVRRIITLFRYANKLAVIPGKPVNLRDFLADKGDLVRGEFLLRLRGDLIDRIDEERETTVGPILKSRRDFIDLILGDKAFLDYLKQTEEKEKKPLPVLLKDSRRYLNEIASDYSETFVELWDKLLTWLWKNIYDGVIVDRKGLARIRDISSQMPLVVVPCHRSHIDYLLLSYVFYKENIQLPFVAAGINLSFWPMGYIFRKSGAFFIRRSFKGHDLYAEVFSRYVRAMLVEKMPVEFFIEGGRSRTGKMVMPKYGLLSMIMRAYQEGGINNLGIIPVYIGYDRVIEEKSYVKELEGVPKTWENTSDVIRSRKVVKKRYGHVYVNIGEPIIFNDYLEKLSVTLESLEDRERQALYRKISYEIALAINRVSVVTPSALVAAAFLAHDRKGIRHVQWKTSLDAFHDYLVYRRAPFSTTLQQEDKAIQEAVDIFLRDQMISINDAGKDPTVHQERIYTLPGEKRLLIDYYKNIIIHYFLPLSFIGLSLLTGKEEIVTLGKILKDYAFLKKLFRNEFIFDDESIDGNEIRESLAYLSARGYIEYEEAGEASRVRFRGNGKEVIKYFAGLLQTYLESYWLVTRSTGFVERQGREEKDWLKEIRRLGLKFYQDGELRRYESLSQQNFQGAIRFLNDTGLISITEKEARKIYQVCGSPDMMDEIRRKIFGYL